MRRLPLVLIAVLTALLVPAAANAATPKAPLPTDGARIVDANGQTAVLQGVHRLGFPTSHPVGHGLRTRDYRDVLAQIKSLGFNTIRLPFSLQALKSSTINGVDFSNGKNAALKGATPLQAMDTIIDEAKRDDLLVLLDDHSLTDDSFSHPLWYGIGG